MNSNKIKAREVHIEALNSWKLAVYFEAGTLKNINLQPHNRISTRT